MNNAVTEGSTVWLQLRAHSAAGLDEFYREVLGWTLEASPKGGLFRDQDGKPIAGLLVDPKLENDQLGWVSFLGTENLEETAQRLLLENATFLGPVSLEVPGKAELYRDPFGALFGIAQVSAQDAIRQSIRPGQFVLTDPTNHDIATQINFHLAIFDHQHIEEYGHGINIVRNSAGEALRGAYALPEELKTIIPAHWLPWFSISHHDESIARVAQVGGTVNVSDSALDIGRYAVVVDPQGGSLKLLEVSLPFL